MWKTNLKIVATVLVTLGVYTGISNVIPQVESQVPERVEVGPNTSTQELIAMGEKIYHGAGGCEACHGLGTRAPTLLGEVGNRCGQRQPELSCKQYLHRSLTEPRDFVVEGFQPIMPDMSAQLSPGQIWALVAFLQSQGGEVTVTSEDLASAGQGGGGPSAGGGAGPAAGGAGGQAGGPAAGGGSMEPGALAKQYGCLACHQLDGTGGATAPPFEAIREQGHPSEYIRRSILQPNADTASGYERDYSQFAGTMLGNFGQRLSDAELQTFVDWLSAGGNGGS